MFLGASGESVSIVTSGGSGAGRAAGGDRVSGGGRPGIGRVGSFDFVEGMDDEALVSRGVESSAFMEAWEERLLDASIAGFWKEKVYEGFQIKYRIVVTEEYYEGLGDADKEELDAFLMKVSEAGMPTLFKVGEVGVGARTPVPSWAKELDCKDVAGELGLSEAVQLYRICMGDLKATGKMVLPKCVKYIEIGYIEGEFDSSGAVQLESLRVKSLGAGRTIVVSPVMEFLVIKERLDGTVDMRGVGKFSFLEVGTWGVEAEVLQEGLKIRSIRVKGTVEGVIDVSRFVGVENISVKDIGVDGVVRNSGKMDSVSVDGRIEGVLDLEGVLCLWSMELGGIAEVGRVILPVGLRRLSMKSFNGTADLGRCTGLEELKVQYFGKMGDCGKIPSSVRVADLGMGSWKMDLSGALNLRRLKLGFLGDEKCFEVPSSVKVLHLKSSKRVDLSKATGLKKLSIDYVPKGEILTIPAGVEEVAVKEFQGEMRTVLGSQLKILKMDHLVRCPSPFTVPAGVEVFETETVFVKVVFADERAVKRMKVGYVSEKGMLKVPGSVEDLECGDDDDDDDNVDLSEVGKLKRFRWLGVGLIPEKSKAAGIEELELSCGGSLDCGRINGLRVLRVDRFYGGGTVVVSANVEELYVGEGLKRFDLSEATGLRKIVVEGWGSVGEFRVPAALEVLDISRSKGDGLILDDAKKLEELRVSRWNGDGLSGAVGLKRLYLDEHTGEGAFQVPGGVEVLGLRFVRGSIDFSAAESLRQLKLGPISEGVTVEVPGSVDRLSYGGGDGQLVVAEGKRLERFSIEAWPSDTKRLAVNARVVELHSSEDNIDWAGAEKLVVKYVMDDSLLKVPAGVVVEVEGSIRGQLDLSEVALGEVGPGVMSREQVEALVDMAERDGGGVIVPRDYGSVGGDGKAEA